MDSEDGKDQVVEEKTPPKDSNSNAELSSDTGISVSSDSINREVPQNGHNTQTHSELTLNNDRPSIRNIEEDGVPAQSTVNSSGVVQDCCILVPESAYALPKRKRFNLLGCLNNRDNLHGMVKPEDSNSLPEPSSRQVTDRGVGDVPLNLTEFLTYAERNHCDIFFPASLENRSLNTNLPRIGTGRGFNVSRASANWSVAELIDYSHMIMNERRRPSRNSVLAQNMYHPGDDIRPPVVDFNAPPPYEMPMKLPTYEEVQREKALEGELFPPADMPNADANSSRTLSFLAIDAEMGTNVDPESKLLGSDFMFAVAFVLALVFNWIGFLLLMCFCHTVASRYGALSGFGLSLAKWTIIVKNSMEAPIHNAWLWWLITTFGLLICVRSLFQYINIKRGWRLMSAATQERFLFFY